MLLGTRWKWLWRCVGVAFAVPAWVSWWCFVAALGMAGVVLWECLWIGLGALVVLRDTALGNTLGVAAQWLGMCLGCV